MLAAVVVAVLAGAEAVMALGVFLVPIESAAMAAIVAVAFVLLTCYGL